MLFLTLQCLQAYLDLKKTPNLQNETKERLVNNCHEYNLLQIKKHFKELFAKWTVWING